MKRWFGRLLRYGLLLLAVLAVCWGGVYLAARYSQWRPDNSALVMYLVVIPLLVFVALVLLWRGIQAYRQQRAEEAEAARAAEAAQAQVRERVEAQTQDRRFDRLAMLAGNAITCHADTVAELKATWEAQDAGLTLPLSAGLFDSAGYPLRAGEIARLEGVGFTHKERVPALLAILLEALTDELDAELLLERRTALLALPVDDAQDRFYQHQPRQRSAAGVAVLLILPAGLDDGLRQNLREEVASRLREALAGLTVQPPKLLDAEAAQAWLAAWQDETLYQPDALACVLAVDSCLDDAWLQEAEQAGVLLSSRTSAAAQRQTVMPGESAAWMLLGNPAWVDDTLPILGWLGRAQQADTPEAALQAAQVVAGLPDGPAEPVCAVMTDDASSAQAARTATALSACLPDCDPIRQRFALGQHLGVGGDNWVVQALLAACWSAAGPTVMLRQGPDDVAIAWPVIATLPQPPEPTETADETEAATLVTA